MSYALAGYQGMGAVITPSCGVNEMRNPVTKECYCNIGFEDDGSGCKPIQTNKPCTWTGQVRTELDQKCECPPGYLIDPDPQGTSCIQARWFPNCVDANGNRVDNCLFGYPMNAIIPAVAIGSVLGAGIAFLIMRARA